MTHAIAKSIVAFLLLIGISLEANATCGLDVCPVSPGHVDDNGDVTPLMGLRHTSVTDNAHYTEATFGALVQANQWLQLGVNIPLLTSSIANSTTIGIGNVVPFATAQLFGQEHGVVSNMGIQIETPTATNPALGDSHFLVLPTTQLGWQSDQLYFLTTLGWGRTLGGSHKHAADTDGSGDDQHVDHGHGHDDHHSSPASAAESIFIVNPHSESELLLRMDVGAGWTVGKQIINAGVRTDLVEDVSQDESTGSIVTMGPTIQYGQSKMTAEVFFLMPISQTERFRTRSGLRIRAPF